MNETKTEYVQEVHVQGNQVKIADKWVSVEGQAQQFLHNLRAPLKAEIGRDKAGNITFIKKVAASPAPTSTTSTKDERITRMAMMNTASKILEPFQAPSPGERAGMVIELAKKLQVYVDTGENPFDQTPSSEKVE